MAVRRGRGMQPFQGCGISLGFTQGSFLFRLDLRTDHELDRACPCAGPNGTGSYPGSVQRRQPQRGCGLRRAPWQQRPQPVPGWDWLARVPRVAARGAATLGFNTERRWRSEESGGVRRTAAAGHGRSVSSFRNPPRTIVPHNLPLLKKVGTSVGEYDSVVNRASRVDDAWISILNSGR